MRHRGLNLNRFFRSNWTADITVSRVREEPFFFLSLDFFSDSNGFWKNKKPAIQFHLYCSLLQILQMVKRISEGRMAALRTVTVALVVTVLVLVAEGIDTNEIYSPCLDAQIQKSDGFTFGVAFASKDSFFQDQIQFSPCDKRLALIFKNAQLAVFRPKVDQLSLLTINSTTFNPGLYGGYMVAFAGLKYAARSLPVMITDNSHTITSFTLVFEFQKGTLQNLFWKKFGCEKCTGEVSVCLDNQDCAVPNSKCKYNGGSIDCNLSIQLAFSGTDRNLEVLNSWFEVDNLRRFSLYKLFSDVRDTVTNPFG